MKIAIIMQCHKSPDQINVLLRTLMNERIDFFIHVDLKSDISDQIDKSDNVYLLPDESRVNVEWSKFSQVEATLNLLRYATKLRRYDYYCLISGQDFPLFSSEYILEFLSKDPTLNFMNLFISKNNGWSSTNNYDKRNQIRYPNWMLSRALIIRVLRRAWVAITGGYNYTFRCFLRKPVNNLNFYFGSSWWCLNNNFVVWMMSYLSDNPQYATFFTKSVCADESFFQTLFMNSPFKETRRDYLHYIDWSEGKSSPKNLSKDDFCSIISSGKLFARKINEDYELINMLVEHINNN